MKKLITIITVVCIGSLLIPGIQAQTMVEGGTDSVTVGSIMPYAVTGDADIQTLVGLGALDASQFDWKITSGTGTIQTIASGLSLYPDSITILWPGPAGTAAISVAENSIRSGVIQCADPTPSTLNITIFDVPTIEFNGTDTGACAAANYDIPLTLSGIYPYTITYTISYEDLSGNPPTDVTTGSPATISSGSVLPITSSQLGSGAGTYTITITNLDDRISSKALNGGTVNGDINGTGIYKIYVYPTPNTSPIRHVEN